MLNFKFKMMLKINREWINRKHNLKDVEDSVKNL